MYCSGYTHRAFYIKSIVSPHFGLEAHLMVKFTSFGFLPSALAWLLRETCGSQEGEGGDTQEESFLWECHVPLSVLPSSLFLFPHPLFFKLQMPKKMPTDTTLPQWLLPRAFSQVALNFFLLVKTFPPFFSLVFGPQFLDDFYYGYVLPNLSFYKTE